MLEDIRRQREQILHTRNTVCDLIIFKLECLILFFEQLINNNNNNNNNIVCQLMEADSYIDKAQRTLKSMTRR